MGYAGLANRLSTAVMIRPRTAAIRNAYGAASKPPGGVGMGECLTNTDLNRYHACELNEADEARVREHLAECEQCGQGDAELVVVLA